MRTFILLFTLSTIVYSKSILFIGDSHTAGPFGQLLHKKLAQFHNVATFGHASSAAIHWLTDKEIKLSGGVFNELFIDGKTFKNPSPTHWRVKVKVPKFLPLLKDVSYHSEWSKSFTPNLIIIALGANDARAISNDNGVIRERSYNKRQLLISNMIDALNVPCIWIGPPNGVKKSQANQKVLYKFLEEAIIGRCDFMSSNHYMVKGCDGIHMNCSSEMDNARKWVSESFRFIQAHL